MKAKNVLFPVIILALFSMAARAQIKMPQASPSSQISQKVGLTTFDLDYSRPSKRDRKVFGELVPFGAIWRTGANNPTTIQFDTDIIVEGKKLPQGKYALYTIPDKNRWTIIFSKNTSLWGSMGYNEKDDALRFTVSPKKTKDKVETMEINFTEISDTGSTLELDWDKTKVKFRIETEVDPIVMAQIKEQLIDKDSDNPVLYFQAANYYYTNGKDLQTALDWIHRSVTEDPKYYTVHLKAKIEAALGSKTRAISTAQQSLEMAKEAKNPDYIALNQRLITSLK